MKSTDDLSIDVKSCCCFYLQFLVQFIGDSGMWHQYGNKY